MHSSQLYLAVTFLFTQCVIGCRPSISLTATNAASSDVASIAITIQDNYYGDSNSNLSSPPLWTVPSGAAVVATVQNLGLLNHNWAIIRKDAAVPIPFDDGQSSKLILYGAGMIYGKNVTTFTFNAPEELGEYLVICTVPGHYPRMQGRLVVQ